MTDHLNWLYACNEDHSVSAYETADSMTSKKKNKSLIRQLLWLLSSSNYYFNDVIDDRMTEETNISRVNESTMTQKTSLIYNFED